MCEIYNQKFEKSLIEYLMVALGKILIFSGLEKILDKLSYKYEGSSGLVPYQNFEGIL